MKLTTQASQTKCKRCVRTGSLSPPVSEKCYPEFTWSCVWFWPISLSRAKCTSQTWWGCPKYSEVSPSPSATPTPVHTWREYNTTSTSTRKSTCWSCSNSVSITRPTLTRTPTTRSCPRKSTSTCLSHQSIWTSSVRTSARKLTFKCVYELYQETSKRITYLKIIS